MMDRDRMYKVIRLLGDTDLKREHENSCNPLKVGSEPCDTIRTLSEREIERRGLTPHTTLAKELN